MISARPTTNGGVMIGSTVNRRSAFLPRKLDRVTISASSRPRNVVPAAHSNASHKVFHATPQPDPPHRQAGVNAHNLRRLKRSQNAMIDRPRS